MSYLCRLFLNSGYNASNIPDSPARLAGVTYIDVPALDIMQDRGLSEIRVKVSGWDAIKNADYMYLANTATNPATYWYYTIDDIQMLAMDVASLAVTPDYITSVGGVTALTFLDGLTERVHVASDTYGEHALDDPLLTPSEPLKMSTFWLAPTSQTGDLVYIEVRVDPVLSILKKAGREYSYTDPVTQEELTVIVPQVARLNKYTDFYLGDPSQSGTPTTENAKTLILLMTNEKATGATVDGEHSIEEGLSIMRALGLENGVISQTQIPIFYATCSTTLAPYADPDDPTVIYTHPACDELHGVWRDTASGLAYVLDANVKNNRINYSSFTKYGLLTATGESCEYEPADIYESGETSPHVRTVGDPRPTGRPYFRFKSVNGDITTGGFFKNAVSGMHWKSVPLVYTAPSGTALNTLRYQNSLAISQDVYEYQTNQNAIAQMKNTVDLALGSISSGVLSALGQSGGLGFGGIAGSAWERVALENQSTHIKNQFQASRKSELSDLEISNTVASPVVFFPFNAEVVRDFLGNGALIYRYEYTASDRARIDKLLTMYGYRVEKALESSDFTNRQYFNFVKAQNVTVTGFARWLNDAIGDQLRAGVRVWHTAPSVTHYANNPVVTP